MRPKIGLAIGLKAITLDAGELPVDYRSYVEAAERFAGTGSPYPDAETALAYILLLVGRPITWSMPLLTVFVLAAVWPVCERSERIAHAAMADAIGLTHRVALVLFPLGIWPGLLTLQPGFPWESLLVLPGTWTVVPPSRGTTPSRTTDPVPPTS